MSVAEEYIPRYAVEKYRRWEDDRELIMILLCYASLPIGVYQKIIAMLLSQILSQINLSKEPCYVYPELDWIVDQDTIVRPDLMVVCKDVPEHFMKPPDVVIEVISPDKQ